MLYTLLLFTANENTQEVTIRRLFLIWKRPKKSVHNYVRHKCRPEITSAVDWALKANYLSIFGIHLTGEKVVA